MTRLAKTLDEGGSLEQAGKTAVRKEGDQQQIDLHSVDAVI